MPDYTTIGQAVMFYINKKNIENFLQSVADGAGMTVGVLKSSKCRRATDARYIAIMLLSELMTDDEMAQLFGLTRQGVNYLRNDANRRRCRQLQQVISKLRASGLFACLDADCYL